MEQEWWLMPVVEQICNDEDGMWDIMWVQHDESLFCRQYVNIELTKYLYEYYPIILN